MSDKIIIEVKIAIDHQFIDDVLGTAFDSGISYWCDRARPSVEGDFMGGQYASDIVSRGGTVILELQEPIDDDNILEYNLDLEKFIKGLQKYAQNCAENGREIWMDAGDIDAGDADMIIQYALFGEIVFS